jgi:hypothetical protein
MKKFLCIILISGFAAGADVSTAFKKLAQNSDMVLYRFDSGQSLRCLKGNWSDFSKDRETQSFMKLVFGMEGDDSLIILKDEGKVTYTAYKVKNGGIRIDDNFIPLKNILLLSE